MLELNEEQIKALSKILEVIVFDAGADGITTEDAWKQLALQKEHNYLWPMEQNNLGTRREIVAEANVWLMQRPKETKTNEFSLKYPHRYIHKDIPY